MLHRPSLSFPKDGLNRVDYRLLARPNALG